MQFHMNKVLYKVMNKTFVFFLTLIFLTNNTSTNAQTRSLLLDSTYQLFIHTLKTGCLLVELSDRAGIRAKLVQHDQTERLKRFDYEIDKEFNEIFSAFQKYYNFGAVYFYYKSESHFLKQRSFHKMRWFNSSRTAVASSEIDTTKFLLGTFGRMERADSLVNLDEKGKVVSKEAKLSFQAFVFRDMKERIIDKNYFLHVRTIFQNKTKVIRLLNSNLQRNYNSILKLKTKIKTLQNEN